MLGSYGELGRTSNGGGALSGSSAGLTGVAVKKLKDFHYEKVSAGQNVERGCGNTEVSAMVRLRVVMLDVELRRELRLGGRLDT